MYTVWGIPGPTFLCWGASTIHESGGGTRRAVGRQAAGAQKAGPSLASRPGSIDSLRQLMTFLCTCSYSNKMGGFSDIEDRRHQEKASECSREKASSPNFSERSRI